MKNVRIQIEEPLYKELRMYFKRRKEMGEMLNWNMFLICVLEEGKYQEQFLCLDKEHRDALNNLPVLNVADEGKLSLL
jgi:hypothetical protein